MVDQLNDLIEGFVAGDSVQVRFTVSGVPAGDTLQKAYFTVKAFLSQDDAGALFQKSIGLSWVAGQGQITDTGADGTGEVIVDLLPADTVLLDPTFLYWYDLQCHTALGAIYTPSRGRMQAAAQVTRATS